MNEEYDYIIAGAGLSGLSLATRLAEPKFADKRILIVDQSKKDTNDRTWSFWQLESEQRCREIFHKTWRRLRFYGPDVDRSFETAPYAYHTIRGIDFYQYAFEIINKASHITFLLGNVGIITSAEDAVEIEVDGKLFKGRYVFDSIVRSFPKDDKLFVWQHFMGWELTMEEDVFDDEVATFMDFRIDQVSDVRFVYVLPFTKRKALVEATLFSKEIGEKGLYEEILTDYLKTYFPGKNYKVDQVELGAIPMTSASFANAGNRVIPIGTNNGTVKPSSGYAFVRIQEECDRIVENLAKGIFIPIKRKRRFAAYDKTLLNVLLTNKVSGQRVFGDMFKYNDPSLILKFLDERTSLIEETGFFKTLPILSFTRAFIVEQWRTLTERKQD
ncbi:MAG: lycopene beta-cyclase [Saprospiraceae bacterium]|jgi:lycopene beta-cyclase